MSELHTEQLKYVGQVLLPLGVWGPPNQRHAISEPQRFEFSRGYWEFAFELDHLETQRPVGITLVAELYAENRKLAEQMLLAGAASLSTTLGFHTSSEIQVPMLQKIAEVGIADGLVCQSEYIYRIEATSRVRLTAPRFDRLNSRMMEIPREIRERIELAQRWYRESISSQDPVDEFIAAWFGWEAVFPKLDDKLHLEGTNSECAVCEPVQSPGRNRSGAAYDHISIQVAPDLRSGHDYDDLARLRGDIAHGRRSLDECTSRVVKIVGDFQLVLAQGILVLLRIAVESTGEETEGRWAAALPRDTKIRPDLRFWAQLDQEMTDLRPFFGGWLRHEMEDTDEDSTLSDDGLYTYRSGLADSWYASTDSAATISKTGCERYNRFGVTWRSIGESEATNECPEVPWNDQEIPPSWLRVVSEHEERQNT